MNRLALTLPGAALALACALAVSAQTAALPQSWKWKDSSGQVQYSDTPPPLSVPDKDILERPPLQQRVRAAANPPAPPASAPKPGLLTAGPRVDPELEARRKKATDEQQVQARAGEDKNAAQRAENCSRARGQLVALSEGQRKIGRAHV